MAELDPVIHAQARLRIIATLATIESRSSLAFPQVQELLDMTAGNLSTHLRRLEEAGYVTQEKVFRARKPVTYLAITSAGRAAYEEYRAQLQNLLKGEAP